jgi:hypothetical protein
MADAPVLARDNTQLPPIGGLDVSPKSEMVIYLEKSDPVARRCAQLGDGLAAKVRGQVGDVSIERSPDGGTVWGATLLMAKEPPLAPKMTCDARSFRVANDIFDVSMSPDEMSWPTCGWGLPKGDRVGLAC